MEGFSIKAVGNQAVIKVDLSLMSIESVNRLFDRLRVEQLVQKAKFVEDVEEIASKLKEDWWKKNRNKYLESENHADRD